MPACNKLLSTFWKQSYQRAHGGVDVTPVLGAAENGLLEGGRYGALQTDFLRPLQTASLELYPVVINFDRGEALGAMALGVLEAFRAFTQTRQLSICERQGVNSPYTMWVYFRKQAGRRLSLSNLQVANLAKHNREITLKDKQCAVWSPSRHYVH